MSHSDREAESNFRLALERLVDAAEPFAHLGDGNCGYVLEEVRAALRDGGLYRKIPSTRPKKARIPQWLRTRVFERDAYRCVHCGSYQSLCADHVVAESKGGPTTFENLQTLCSTCNSKKGASDA